MENTKQRILTKALELFSVSGYEAVSVEQIAKAVGIKAPSLYKHYKGKQAIFDAIVEDTAKRYGDYTDRLSVHVESADKDLPVFEHINADALCDKVRKIFIYSLRDEAVARFRRLMTIEQFHNGELAKMYTARYVDRLTAYHSDIFRHLIEVGEIRDEDPDALAVMYVSPIIALIGVCDRHPEREAECLEKLDAHVRLFYRTFNVTGR